jgi:hypothetical protein
VNARLFDKLWGGSDLVVLFRKYLLNALTLVEHSTTLLEVALDHVEKLVIVPLIDSWVLNDDASETVQSVSNLLTLILSLVE